MSGYECQLPAALFTHPPLCTSVSTSSRHLHAFAYEALTVMFYGSISLISYFQYPRTAALLHTASSDQSIISYAIQYAEATEHLLHL